METELEIADMNDEVEEDVCALCENGGELLSCEGGCLRSFHPTVESGLQSMCKTLGLSKEEVEAIPVFKCKNCRYKQHQCFACGELGSSDKSSGAEVFRCASGDCGRFYHAHCAAKQLHCQSKAEVEELEQKILSGEAFTCPSHKCVKCRGIEDHEDSELQFAICQRCPNSYHRKCLPRTVKLQRSWENLLPNHRILIFCLAHEFDNKLKTPKRNHIKFPNIGEKNRNASQLLKSRGKLRTKEKCLTSNDAAAERLLVESPKLNEKVSVKQGNSSKKRTGTLSNLESSKKQKVPVTVQSSLNKNPSEMVNKPVITRNDNTGINEYLQSKTEEYVMNETSALPPLDADSQRRIMDIMSDAASSVKLEEIMRLRIQQVPETHSCSSLNAEVKSITLGKVELSIEALHEALQKLEQGFSVEDAKAICGPELLKQINVWKNELKVYLAPFLDELDGEIPMPVDNNSAQEEKAEQVPGEAACITESCKERFVLDNGGTECCENIDKVNNAHEMASDVRNDETNSYQVSHAPEFSAPSRHRHPVQAAEPIDTSTKERYAPRLEEFNRARMSPTLGFEPLTPSTRWLSNPPAFGPECEANMLGFAPCIRQPFSQNSVGWIEE